MALHPAETRVNVRGQERADQIAEVLDPVNIGQGACDNKSLFHGFLFSGGANPIALDLRPGTGT
jgi:hypothetical protein